MRPPPAHLRVCCPFSSSSSAAAAVAASQPDDTPLLRRDLGLLLSRPAFDPALCRATLACLHPRRLDDLLDSLGPSLSISPAAALRFFSFASRRLGFPFTPHSYAILAHSLLPPAARLLLTRLLDPRTAPPVVRLHDLADALAATRPPAPAPAPALDTLVHVCCTQFGPNGLRLAVDAFRTITDRGACASLKTCNFLLTALAKSRRCSDACQVFDIMQRHVSPDVYSYTPLIDVLCKCRAVGEAVELFEKMEASGVTPTVITYNALIDGLCKERMLDKAFRLKEKMVVSSVKPSVVTYSVLVNGLVKADRFQDVDFVLKEMSGKGIVPNLFIYNTLIDGHCSMGRCEEAVKLWDEFVAKGIELNSVSYNALLKGFCNAGRMEQAECFLEKILMNGTVLNEDVFSSIISWLLTANVKVDLAVRFAKEMLVRNLRPSDPLLRLLIDRLCDNGKHNEAVEIWKVLDKGFGVSNITSNALICRFRELGNIDDAVKVLNVMLRGDRLWIL